MAKVKVKDLLQDIVGKNVDFQTEMEVEESELIPSRLIYKEIKEQKLSGVQLGFFLGLCFVDTLKDGLLDGVSEGFYHKGKIAYRVHYKRGKQHGTAEKYNRDGTLESRKYFENGIQIENKE